MEKQRDTFSLNEAQARYLLIDPALRRAGWNLDDRTQVRFEVPVDGYDAEPWNGVTDYSLYFPSAEVSGVVEAKRTSRNAREGEEQIRYYITYIAERQGFTPFAFLTNGINTYFWEVGIGNPRLVAGFFSPDDLARLRFLRENGKQLESVPINAAIVDRPYQHEAIRRVAEAFSKGKRRALLVMATGSGKTRTTMALIDLFLRVHRSAE